MDGDLQRVAGRLTGLALKRPGFALSVYGPPGIGKTHAVLALLRGAQCRSLTVHATQPLEGIVLQLPHPKRLSAWLERGLERLRGGEVLATEALLQTLAGVLSANAPFILHVEDLHESSSERLEFWTQLAQTATRLRGVALIVTSRTRPLETQPLETQSPAPLEAIGLRPLTREASDALLVAEAGTALPAEALEWIFGHALGNPLFSLEFFRFLARQGTLWNDGQRWRWRTPQRDVLPVTIEALIEQVLRKVAATPNLEAVLSTKALLGLNSSETLWWEMTELSFEDFSQARKTLEASGALTGRDFAHPLYGEVVARQLLKPQREFLARRALRILEGAPEMAAKFIEDANLEPALAFEWFSRAAERMTLKGDNVQVARFQARAASVAPSEQRASLVLQAAQVLQASDSQETSRLLELIALSESTSAELILFTAEFWARHGQLSRAVTALEYLPESARTPALLNAHLVRLHALAHDFPAAVTIWQSNTDSIEHSDSKTLVQAGLALTQTGQHAEAERLARKTLERPTLTTDVKLSLQNLLASTLAYQGNVPAALEIWDALILGWTDEQYASQRAAALSNCAQMRSRSGAFQQARQNAQEAVRTALNVGDLGRLAHMQVILADIQIKQGLYEEAQTILLELHTLLREKPQVQLCNVEFALSSLYQYWASPQATYLQLRYARLALETAITLQNPMHTSTALSLVAIAETNAGDAASAFRHANEALEKAEQLQHPVLRISALNSKGTALEALQQTDGALSVWSQAKELAEQYGLHEYVYQIKFDMARVTGDLEAIGEVRAWFVTQGLQNTVDLIDQFLPTLVTPVPLEPQSPARLEVLGTLQVSLSGATTPVRGRKRQELLALLLEARIAGRGETSKLELMDALYPDADELQSSAGLRDVIYQLRSNLGNAAITTTAGGYALGNLGSDLEEFLKCGDTGLWRGAYLAGLTLSSSDSVRESVYLALRSRAEALLPTDPTEATRVGRLVCEADPYDLEAVRLTLLGLRSGGNHRSLSRVYEQARTRFSEIGETLPAAWQDFLVLERTTPLTRL